MTAGADGPAPERREHWTAVREAFEPLASSVRPCSGGVLLEAGDVPLAATGAIWLPRSSADDRGSDRADPLLDARAWIVPAGTAADAIAARSKRAASLGISLRPIANHAPVGPTLGAGTRGHGPRDRAWDGATEVARRLAKEANAVDAAWTDSLTVLLASWAADDPDLRLIVDDASEAAAVVVDRSDTVVVALHAGGSDLAERLVSEAVATGREGMIVRVVAPDDAAAELIRLEPAT